MAALLHIESMTTLADGSSLAEVIMKGNLMELGGMIEGAMYGNPDLSALLIASVKYYCQARQLDIKKLFEAVPNKKT
jgi:hypothetical protein